MILGTLVLTALLSSAAGHGKRDLSQLEYVVKVLEQQGRLGEVDTHLLARINEALDKKEPAVETPVVEEETVRRPEVSRSFSSAKERFLERARLRQQKLFGRKNKVEDRQEVRQEVRVEDQCREEREAVRRLERRVLELEEELELSRECRSSPQARHITGPSQQVNSLAPSPLDKLLQAASREETVELQGSLEEGVIVSSHLVTPTPTVSTIFSSLTTVTVLTLTHTQELVVNFRGRKIPTKLLEEEEVTSTLTSTVTSTIEITPTPSWQFVTITPTPTVTESVVIPPPETVNSLLLRQRIEQEKQALMERIQVLQVPAQVVEIPKSVHNIEALQQYVEDLRRLRTEKTATIRAEPQVAQPTTSVSTIYMSGSKPGEFSTVLSTVTLDRIRREATCQPSTQTITVTSRPPDI